MSKKYSSFLSSGLAALSGRSAQTQLPYNPTRVLASNNGSVAYILAPQQSSEQFTLSVLNTSAVVDSSTIPTLLDDTLPFLSTSSSKAFIPISDTQNELTILVGNCKSGANGVELWQFTAAQDSKAGSWHQLKLSLGDTALSVDYLSAGFTFSATGSANDESFYVFGGMCPDSSTSTSSDWTGGATYSNTMLTLLTDADTPTDAPFEVSITGARAPPIPEAGLSITPLMPTYSSLATGSNVSRQQNFVLLGGHTQNAFINMSQVAMYSLPEQSWAFIGVDQPAASGANDELFAREVAIIEPRSGHTAVLTTDGTKVILLGGWVGDIDTPATPQLAVLNVAEGYGGIGDWAWSIPQQETNPFPANSGIYGHGAVMLPGDVMMVYGGFHVSSSGSKQRRQSSPTVSDRLLFFNVSSSAWISSYTNPLSPASPAYSTPVSPPSGLLGSPSQRAGLGAGLALGLAVIAAILAFWIFYARRLRQRRAAREKELRELALGAERHHSITRLDDALEPTGAYPAMRTASWSSRQEKRLESKSDAYPWAPVMNNREHTGRIGLTTIDPEDSDGIQPGDRRLTSFDVPGPSRGLRRSLHSRGPMSYSASFGPLPGGVPNSVFRIDEEDEGSQGGSLKRKKTPATDAGDNASSKNDPFKDPPMEVEAAPKPIDDAAEQRKKELEGWVEDWNAAAESMHLSRNNSQATQARTYSNLSTFAAQHASHSGRGSPEKSDRTGSNLSDRSIASNCSMQPSVTGSVSRNPSAKGASAGYTLFASAAAAMAARVAGTVSKTNSQREYGTVNSGKGSISRAPSRRSTSLNLNSTSSSQGSRRRERSDTFSTARTSIGPLQPGDEQTLLSRMNSKSITDEKEYWATPPESPTKEKYRTVAGPLGSQPSRKALGGILGSVKRVLTGTYNVDVADRVADFESRSENSSPTKTPTSHQPQMIEVGRRTSSAGAALWRGKRGAKDWMDDSDTGEASSSAVQRGLGNSRASAENNGIGGGDGVEDDADWDVETAIQKRVVQVMFTVPKEKLRVVNADSLSLLSKSDVDFENEKGENEAEVKRMSSVLEKDEKEAGEDESAGDKIVVAANPAAIATVATGDHDANRDKGKGKAIERKPVGSGVGNEKTKKKKLKKLKFQFEDDDDDHDGRTDDKQRGDHAQQDQIFGPEAR